MHIGAEILTVSHILAILLFSKVKAKKKFSIMKHIEPNGWSTIDIECLNNSIDKWMFDERFCILSLIVYVRSRSTVYMWGQ